MPNVRAVPESSRRLPERPRKGARKRFLRLEAALEKRDRRVARSECREAVASRLRGAVAVAPATDVGHHAFALTRSELPAKVKFGSAATGGDALHVERFEQVRLDEGQRCARFVRADLPQRRARCVSSCSPISSGHHSDPTGSCLDRSCGDVTGRRRDNRCRAGSKQRRNESCSHRHTLAAALRRRRHRGQRPSARGRRRSRS